jgi:hypothetical protein
MEKPTTQPDEPRNTREQMKNNTAPAPGRANSQPSCAPAIHTHGIGALRYEADWAAYREAIEDGLLDFPEMGAGPRNGATYLYEMTPLSGRAPYAIRVHVHRGAQTLTVRLERLNNVPPRLNAGPPLWTRTVSERPEDHTMTTDTPTP